MPATLPDPVLALSMANIQKLNSADVDQLANLWNVFTKCKESLESGRRLENLSWRLWYREAHVLPPDASLSDMTDFTPQGTPLASRRGSINGTSLQAQRAMSSLSPHHPASAGQSGVVSPNGSGAPGTSLNNGLVGEPLSDPEGGEGWSDEESEESETSPIEAKSDGAGKRSSSKAASPITPAPKQASQSMQKEPGSISNKAPSPAHPASRRDTLTSPPLSLTSVATHANAVMPRLLQADRRRTISSSSAFGSRARVKQANMHHRNRPISFQQAVESLLKPEAEVGYARSSGRAGLATHVADGKHRKSLEGLEIEGQAGKQNPSRELLTTLETASVEASLGKSAPSVLSAPQSPTASTSMPKTQRANVDPANNIKKPTKSARFHVGSDVADENDGVENVANIETRNASADVVGEKTSERDDNKTIDDVAQKRSNAPVRLRRGRGRGHSFSGSRSRSGIGLNRRETSGLKASRPLGHRRTTSSTVGDDDEEEVEDDHQATTRGDGPRRDSQQSGNSASSVKHQDSSKAVEEEHAGSGLSAAQSKPPVKFHMGSVGSEDGSEDGATSSRRSASFKSADRPSAMSDQKGETIAEEAVVEGEDQSDEWASDTSAEAEEEEHNARKRAEQDEKDSMFKKMPIRSKSAADLQLLAPSNQKHIDEATAAMGTSPTPAIRGLLSSIFHPEDDTPMRRSHASAADLRHNAPPHAAKTVRKTSEGERPSNASVARRTMPGSRAPAPMTQVGSLQKSVLPLSKSAVALPVLSTTGSRSTTQGSRKEAKRSDATASKNAAVFDESDDEDGASVATTETGSQGAMDRLEELARTRRQGKVKKHKSDEQGRSRKSKKRNSSSSLEVQVEPELDEEEIRLNKRTTSPSQPEPVRRTQSAINMPETGLPQSPRTTRRNMLRDELSESLRQNLLWERKSRNRNLGIGVPPATSASGADSPSRVDGPSAHPSGNQPSQQSRAPARSNRHPTLLSNNHLRPLTSRSGSDESAPISNQQQREQQRTSQNGEQTRRMYTGDFHHTGW